MLKKLVVMLTAVVALYTTVQPAAGYAANLSGAGATFPAPIYAKWAEIYKASTGVGLNYQAIGSGGGIKQIKARTVSFGASDKPLMPAELAASGLYQFPTVMGGVVPIVNLPGVRAGQIKLTGALLADIYLGNIRKWSDPRIVAANPGVRLLAIPITVVHRSDGSGTSFLFTTWLAMKSPAWAKRVGAGDAVAWPAGIGGKGNDGVSAFVRHTIGSIGYVEYAFARQTGAAFVRLQNRAGAFPLPSAPAFFAAASAADWAKAQGNYMLLLDQPGATAWPITGVTFVLMYRNQVIAAEGAGVLRFFDWAYKTGDASAVALDYVPLPAPVKVLIRRQWASTIRAGGKPVYGMR